MTQPIVAITMGDPGGIGPEIVLKALREQSVYKTFCPLIIGVRAPLEKAAAKYSSGPLKIRPVGRDLSGLSSREPAFLDVSSEIGLDSKTPFEPGRVSLPNAAMALASLETAADLACQGKVQAVVTAPVHKTAMRKSRKDFQGHTEYLAEKAGVFRYAMMFVSPRLKVTLATIHIPLKDVSRTLTTPLIYDKIMLTDCFLKEHLGLQAPRLGVCALNPHGGETGTEEESVILPAVELARKERVLAAGPLSADQLFYEAYSGHYDGLISMYHDQGLGPFKMVAFHEGVNVTLGLPFIRTSPDHGTAFDIAYQNKADERSMRAAIRLAGELLSSRAGDPRPQELQI